MQLFGFFCNFFAHFWHSSIKATFQQITAKLRQAYLDANRGEDKTWTQVHGTPFLDQNPYMDQVHAPLVMDWVYGHFFLIPPPHISSYMLYKVILLLLKCM